MRVGVVLAAGGSVGVAYHGAVLAALEEATGWDPRSAEIIVGTSAGSITGAMLRAGVPACDLRAISENQPLSAEGARLADLGRPHRPRSQPGQFLGLRPVADPIAVLNAFARPGSHHPLALLAALMPAGQVSTDAISVGLNAVFADGWPAERMWICSVDLRSGRRVVFGKEGEPEAAVGDAVAASCAIPGYFRPVRIGVRRYVDGGVHSMVNLDLVAGLGLDLVVVSSPLSQEVGRVTLAPGTVLRQLLRAQLAREVAALRRTGVPVIAVQPDRRVTVAMGLNPMDARLRGPVSRVTFSSVTQWLNEDGTEGRRLAEMLAGEGEGRPPQAVAM
ncbi:MAG TPA: patatin-like phospholipase family protein [Acidimicrobiales bacterium]|nr:patatin-like phospholipase family protein [Acidimicrobiales bacterium]